MKRSAIRGRSSRISESPGLRRACHRARIRATRWLHPGYYNTRRGIPRACRRQKPLYIGPMAVSSPDLKAFLLATPFFGGLTDASLELLVSMLVERRFEAGATVVAEKEPG